MKKNIVIIHYNTPHLTECLVRSINMFVDNAIIYIFDNSDRYPFTAEFDNVTLFDNTKGQIINFDKWLENYPKRFKSTEATKMFGSAKHCYSVEKCIELVDENFILLDSDVLLKRDISCLYDDRVIYIGEVIKQPYVSVKRVLPFVCFINVEMMKKYGKHYFDDNYMHGLYNNKVNEHADWYDTGAGFYINTLDLPHMDIVCEDYVAHYGAGSYADMIHRKKPQTPNQWLITNKKYWLNKKNVMINEYEKELKDYCKKRNRNINIDNPKTIQDKINWLKVNDMTQLHSDCADKIKVHKYCEKKLGEDICIPIIKIYNNINEINWDELPNKFVIKCNHGSGMNIIVNDKSKINKNDCIAKLNRWMNTDFAFQNGYEMQYHTIERKIFVEEFLDDMSQKNSLYDYKFWCFNGTPHFFTINDGNGHGKWMNYYDINLNPMSCKRLDFIGESPNDLKMPSKIYEMIEYAKKLSEPFKFVRVDFYEVNEKVYLGELTFTPNSGFLKFKDDSYSLKFGQLLDLHKEKNKKVVYTCITGEYDEIIEPSYVTSDFDYICFTDNTRLVSNVWEIRQIPEELNELSNVKKQRYMKINPHLYLSEYELSIWVDGNVNVKGDLNELLDEVLIDGYSVYIPQHPVRNCIYDEARAVVSMKKDTATNVNQQIERYKNEGFPKNYGLLQSNIMLRIHNHKDCIRLMETWWDELKDNSHRDQLSFNYVLWKNSDIKIKYLDKHIYKSQWFSWNVLHKRKNRMLKIKVNGDGIVSKSALRNRIEKNREDFSQLVTKKKLGTSDISIYN